MMSLLWHQNNSLETEIHYLDLDIDKMHMYLNAQITSTTIMGDHLIRAMHLKLPGV